MTRHGIRQRTALLVFGAALVATLAGCSIEVVTTGATGAASVAGSSPATPDASASASTSASTPATSDATDQSPAAPAKAGTALALLATLKVKGRAPMTGYDRVGDFGTAWFDADRNGCDTRDDVLERDLTNTVLSGPCRVLSGVLTDPYTKKVIHFVRGVRTSLAVQIDHMVPLGDAWQTGAQQLTKTQRVDLGNDPINLLAVDGPTNESKGDGDAATWLPPNKAFRCTYVAHQVAVKAAYHLWVTKAEHDAIARVLATCPTTTAPVSKLAPAAFAG